MQTKHHPKSLMSTASTTPSNKCLLEHTDSRYIVSLIFQIVDSNEFKVCHVSTCKRITSYNHGQYIIKILLLNFQTSFMLLLFLTFKYFLYRTLIIMMYDISLITIVILFINIDVNKLLTFSYIIKTSISIYEIMVGPAAMLHNFPSQFD